MSVILDSSQSFKHLNSRVLSGSTPRQSSFSAPMENLVLIQSRQEDAIRNKVGQKLKTPDLPIRQSFTEPQYEFTLDHKSNSLQTTLAITNTMVGSVCLVVPQVFLYNGIVTCTIVLIVLGLVQYKTCQLITKHQKDDEIDIAETIERILGLKWALAARLVSGILLFIVGVVYFLLINTTLYPILVFIFSKTNFENYSGSSSDPVFNKQNFMYYKFSIQYLSMLLFIPLCSLTFIKEIKIILNFARYGVLAIISYGIFVIYIFITNIQSDSFQSSTGDIILFTFNVSEPAGQFALAFTIHNTIGTIMNTNVVKQNNSRDLGMAYTLAGFIYGSIGIFGAFALIGRPTPNNPTTILSFFDTGDISLLIIETLFSIHLISAFPIFNFVSRHQILTAIYQDSDYPYWLNSIYNIIYMCLCLVAQLANFNPGAVIAFNGAVCGFFLIYIVPIVLHMTCYYQNSKSLISKASESVYLSGKLGALNQSKLANEQNESNLCNDHLKISNVTKIQRWIFYICLISVGLFNLGAQLRQLFGF